jgi:hypothetical protein
MIFIDAPIFEPYLKLLPYNQSIFFFILELATTGYQSNLADGASLL